LDQSQTQAKKATIRLGARERGRLQAVLVVVICILLWFIVFRPWLQSLIGHRELQNCQVNAQKIARALTMYQGDWDDAYPPGSIWTTAILGNMAATSNTGFDLERYLRCPLDKSGTPSSYLYNDILGGINPSMRYNQKDEPEKEARRLMVRNPGRFPLIIEKHGSPLNAFATIHNWDEVLQQMTFPHDVPDPTGIIVDGAGNPKRRTRKEVQEQAGKRF
jgi:hypothetical protein